MDPNHDSPSPQPPLDSPPHNSPPKSPAGLPPLPHSPSPQPPQHDDQDALLQSPVDSQETVVSDSDQPMKTFVIKYGEHFISFKRPRHCFNVPNSATPDSPQSKRRIVSPESSESSSESDYSLDSSSDSDSSAICVSSDQEPSSP
ncbi:hypothetical protein QL285_043852 [Trifolium repens]|nr:hypothetical protein QL285_043852 [Trifolium repens]